MADLFLKHPSFGFSFPAAEVSAQHPFSRCRNNLQQDRAVGNANCRLACLDALPLPGNPEARAGPCGTDDPPLGKKMPAEAPKWSARGMEF